MYDYKMNEKLTKREQEVAHLLAQGYTLEKVAEKLSIAITTVKTHKNTLYDKLGLMRGKGYSQRVVLANIINAKNRGETWRVSEMLNFQKPQRAI